MTIYLNKDLMYKYRQNREQMLNRYNISKNSINGDYGYGLTQPYKLAVGAPILVCIDGTYIDANDLPVLALNNRNEVSKWVSELRSPSLTNTEAMNFKWNK